MSVSELLHSSGAVTGASLEQYLFDRVPLFYRSVEHVIETIERNAFMTSVRETLHRLPIAQKFRESHFGEILAAILAEDVLGLRLLYSKLSLNSTQNQNAYKMDLVLYDPKSDPIEFYFGSVKSSPKTSVPAQHDTSCYPDLLRSFREYSQGDLEFDLAAARDHLSLRPDEERRRVKDALMPYAQRTIKYAGFVVIDLATQDGTEMQLLARRGCPQSFNVEVLCVESFAGLADNVFNRLETIRRVCS